MAASRHAAGDDGVDLPSERSFAIVFAAVFAIVAVFPLLHGNGLRAWSLAVAAAILGLGFLAPRVLRPFNRAWAKLGLLMHRVVNPLVMGLLFFGVLTPIGWVMRLRGKRPVDTRLDRGRASYWVVRDPAGPTPASMSEQF